MESDATTDPLEASEGTPETAERREPPPDDGAVATEGGADAEPSFGATAQIEAPLAATNDLDATAAGTEVSARDRSAADGTVQELLFEIPGTHVVQTGAQGAFSSVALRGAELGQTTFLLGDLPLSGPDTGAVDLSLFPLAAFERVEVYRGGAPAWLHTSAIGGVVRLVPRQVTRPTLWATATGGSFGSWRADVGSALRAGCTRLVLGAGADGSRADYPFEYDNATRFDPSDDETRRRANADTLGAHALAHLETELARGRLSAVLLATSRRGGAPGAGASYALRARRNDVRLQGSLAYVHRFERARLQLAAGGGFQRHRFTDRYGEVGLGRQATDDRFGHGFARVASVIALHEVLDLTLVGSARWDGYRPENVLGFEESDSQRTSLAGGAELRLHGRLGGWRFELRPSARLVRSRTETHGYMGFRGEEQRFEQGVTRPTFRVGAAMSPVPALTFTTSAASGVRLPSMLELFGNRGALLPAPDLDPETGRSLDAGAVLRGRAGPLRGAAELRVFHLALDDLIRYRQTSQYTAKAENVLEASVRGLEAGLRGRLGPHLGLHGALTWMDARAPGGATLNWRPRLQAQVQPEVRTGPLGPLRDLVFFASLIHRSAFFQDPANLVEVEARSWLGAGVRVDLACGVSAHFTARDLLDQRGQDYVGFPLPGRRFAFTIRYRMELAP